MNGAHDMGGMHGMGPIDHEKDEPVFHTRWEARAFALTRAMSAWRKWNIDASRHERELIPAAEYLRMSYYEKWIAGLEALIVKHGLVTRAELQTGSVDPTQSKASPPLTVEHVAQMIGRGVFASRSEGAPARFVAGQHVRAKNINPTGHTRLPRYARGKVGLVVRDHGMFVFPDTNAHFQGENPQHVYSVRFTAHELWGEGASPRDAVYLDLWDEYLERA